MHSAEASCEGTTNATAQSTNETTRLGGHTQNQTRGHHGARNQMIRLHDRVLPMTAAYPRPSGRTTTGRSDSFPNPGNYFDFP
jgi:hypothetical protein